jgi:hypothetical protein
MSEVPLRPTPQPCDDHLRPLAERSGADADRPTLTVSGAL